MTQFMAKVELFSLKASIKNGDSAEWINDHKEEIIRAIDTICEEPSSELEVEDSTCIQ